MSGLPSEPVSNRVAAAMLLQASKAGAGYLVDPDGELASISAALQALVHAQLAAIDLVLQQLVPVAQPAAPADRVLYRDRDGDLWTCGADGVTYFVDKERATDNPEVWAQAYNSLAAVEEEHGPLHVVPWPGEVR